MLTQWPCRPLGRAGVGGDTPEGINRSAFKNQGWVTCCVSLPGSLLRLPTLPQTPPITIPLLIWTIESLHQLLWEQELPSSTSWSSLWEPWCPKFPVYWSDPHSWRGQPLGEQMLRVPLVQSIFQQMSERSSPSFLFHPGRGNLLVVPEQFHNRLCPSSTLC